MRGKNTLTTWIMAGIGAVFVLWLAVLIAPYAEGGLPGILLNMNEITAHPFRLELCADTGKAVGIFLGGYALVLLWRRPAFWMTREIHLRVLNPDWR